LQPFTWQHCIKLIFGMETVKVLNRIYIIIYIRNLKVGFDLNAKLPSCQVAKFVESLEINEL
jgi:hypothetical protein